MSSAGNQGRVVRFLREGSGQRLRHSGSAMVEWLIAVPVLLMLGLGFFQASELLVARLALRHALSEAARAGSVSNASAQAIMQGLADGLSPWLYGADGPGEIAAARVRSRAQVALGRASGWVELRQHSPTTASFGDWGEPATDGTGRSTHSRQIAFDALPTEYRLRQPTSGVAGFQGPAPIGRESGQTLADANLLVLELVYGVPVRIPFAGSMLLKTLRVIDGCGSAVGSMTGLQGALGQSSNCRYYNALDLSGQPGPRIPVRVQVVMRMQSAARLQGSLLEPR